MEQNKWKYKLLKGLLDYEEFNLYLSRILDGTESFYQKRHIAIIDQAHSQFLKLDIEEQTIEAFINCIREQITLSDKPEMYAGLTKLSEEYLRQL